VPRVSSDENDDSRRRHHHPGPDLDHHHDHHSLSDAYRTYLSHDSEEADHFDDVCQSYRRYAAFGA
jgi:hypothetical protein